MCEESAVEEAAIEEGEVEELVAEEGSAVDETCECIYEDSVADNVVPAEKDLNSLCTDK